MGRVSISQYDLFLCLDEVDVLVIFLGMKILIVLLMGMSWLCGSEAPKVETLKIGAAAPDFTLEGVDGKRYSLVDFKSSAYLVMVFTCNHCPDARAAWGRLNGFAKMYADKGVQVVAVSTNSPKALMPWENGFSVYGDSFPEMKQVAAERGFVFPYLYDGDTQVVGLAYGAKATPHVFIFGPKRKLLYEGHFDNGHRNPGPASENTVRDNIDALLAGKSVIKERTNVFGCSTKWAYKEAWAIKKQKEWDALPVKVDGLSVGKAKGLFENKGKRVKVVHFWAASGNGGGASFPVLIDTYRRYQKRPFEMVTVGVDSEKGKDGVLRGLKDAHFPTSADTLRFIKKEGRDTSHFYCEGGDVKAVLGLVGESEVGAVPFTVVLAPGGKVLYRKDGKVNDVELRRAIVKGIESL